jgi:hypothetical protein
VTKAWPLLFVLLLAQPGCAPSQTASNSANPGTAQKSSPAAGETAVPSNQSPQQLAAQADVPVYPGAIFPDKMTQAPKKDEDGKMHTYLVMSTQDSPRKVLDFYLKGGKYSEMKTKDGSEIQGLSPKGNLVLVDVTQAGGQTLIDVKSVQGS